MPPRFPYISILFTLIIILTFYLMIISNSVEQSNDVNQESPGVKSIVAYSLMKQIEIESEKFSCRNFEFSNSFHGVYGGDGENRWIQVPFSDVFVSAVFYDDRLRPFYYLRIIAMVKGNWNGDLFCQVENEDSSFYDISKASRTNIWSEEWNQNSDRNNYNHPALFSCQIPNTNKDTIKLSLSTKPCLVFKPYITIKKPIYKETQNFLTICVKPLKFSEDISQRLIQWIEIQKLLGADNFEIYIESVHIKTLRILKWYQKIFENSFKIRVYKPLNISKSDSGFDKVWQKRKNELIPYNECLYRNLYTSQFIIPVDTDEIIVPRHVYTWHHLLNRTFSSANNLQDEFASFTVQNAYYLRQFTKKPIKGGEPVFFLEDITRSELSAKGESGKSFISTRSALTVFNHYALHVLKPGIHRSFFLPSDMVQMNHYKNSCSIELLPQCAKYLSSPVRIIDPVMWKYRKQFKRNYAKTLRRMKKSGIF